MKDSNEWTIDAEWNDTASVDNLSVDRAGFSLGAVQSVVLWPEGKWGPRYEGEARLVLRGVADMDLVPIAPLRRIEPPLWRVLVRQLILRWWWAIQRRMTP